MADSTITVTVGTGTQYLVGGSGNVFKFDVHNLQVLLFLGLKQPL